MLIIVVVGGGGGGDGEHGDISGVGVGCCPRSPQDAAILQIAFSVHLPKKGCWVCEREGTEEMEDLGGKGGEGIEGRQRY